MNKDKALRLALEALEADELAMIQDKDGHMVYLKDQAITAIKAALEAKDEPVGKFAKFTDNIWREVTDGSAGVPLYTTPPQRTWVGLTDEEVDQFHNWKDCTWSTNELVRYVEAKLKQKNEQQTQ
jgi:hypothetical protein